jgi:uroporphyrinogen decarboxylase
MNSKERVLAALQHRETDRVPFDYWAVSAVTGNLISRLKLADAEQLLKHFDVDLRVIQGPRYAGRELAKYPDGRAEDLWGVMRKPVTVTGRDFQQTYMELDASPLAPMETVREIDRYKKWPSPDGWDYSNVARDCQTYAGYAVVNAGDRMDRTAQLKTAMYLRGIEQIMLDMVEHPEIVEAIIRHIVAYFVAYNQRVFQAAAGNIDIFMMGDDFGMQHGLLCSVDMWRRFFKPGFKKYIEVAHAYNIKVMHHTCGAVRELIPDFIECGLDILQSLQPRASGMDFKELKREFGKDICFHGSMDIQQTIPFGTVQDIRNEVKDRMEAGKPHGGFIICTAHNIQADTPVKNVLALFEAYLEYGRY